MSGGHFEPEYCYYQVEQFANELEEAIHANFIKDDWGYHTGYSDETILLLRKQLRLMRRTAEIMRHVDYLYAGDHGEDTFMDRVKQVEKSWDENEEMAQKLDKEWGNVFKANRGENQ